MCKIKDQIERDNVSLNYYESFFNWLDKTGLNKLNEEDINKMEKDSKEPLTVSNRILSDLALNNFDFNPKIGA